MWYLIWRTNKTFFSSASRHCLPITVFVLLMGDGVFSHTAENECEGEWENIDSPRLEASDARLDAAFAWNWCEKFWIFDGAAFGTFGRILPSLSSKLGRDACKLSQAQKKNSFPIVCAEHPSQTLEHHSSFTPKVYTKSGASFARAPASQSFLFAVALKLVISKRLYLKNVLALAQARAAKQWSKQFHWKTEGKTKLLLFSAWQRRNFLSWIILRARNPWVNSERERRSRRKKEEKVPRAFQCKFAW